MHCPLTAQEDGIWLKVRGRLLWICAENPILTTRTIYSTTSRSISPLSTSPVDQKRTSLPSNLITRIVAYGRLPKPTLLAFL